MRHLCATSLAVLLCVHPLLAEGPLARSAVKEAARLAGETGEDGGSDVWKAVRLLDRRAAIVVTRAGQPVAATFVAFTDSAITVMRNGAAESIPLDDIQMVEKRVRRGSALAATLGALGGSFSVPRSLLRSRIRRTVTTPAAAPMCWHGPRSSGCRSSGGTARGAPRAT